MNSVIPLSALDLGIAASLVVLLAILTWWLRLGISQRLLIAAARTVVQLLLLGLVLKYLFDSSHPALIMLIAFVMLAVAGREVMARQHRPFKGGWGYGLGTFSMFISSFTITIFSLGFIVSPEPWYLPQYSIPLLGMMLGNTMTGVALTMDSLTTSAWQQRAVIEQRLMLGEDWRSAIRDIARQSLRTGMIPILNAMAAAGIISIPGMMTGQLLAGSSPFEAAKYQILIMFMISAGTGFAAVMSSWFGAKRLFDDRQRLRLERLTVPKG
ncbi:Probable iron export permease protein FetB [hydrothermal vent metagenome]|uniref:Probable iron export permease protein FetB n=1 Tax=hydrothermal vent metagenome TaxID=652676 RepID=A0A3B1AJS2_9ZZZZ